ncbi:chromate efflux transporter [soil metagenome]
MPAFLQPPSRVVEVAKLFLRLGFTAFGGPAAHIALMEDEVVVRRRWIDRQHFLDLVSSLNFIPGPNSTELAIHLGLIRAGWRGLIVAGVCFIVPAMLIVLSFAFVYVRFGQLPQVQPILGAISAAVIAIVAIAGIRFARASIRGWFTLTIAIVAMLLAYLLRHETRFPPELLILVIGGLAGALRSIRPSSGTLVPAIYVFTLPSIPDWVHNIASMFLLFLRIGATLFGSGYVLISYLHAGLVEQRNWMSEQQLLDAVAVGQFTPGPLLTTATFIGYFLGHTRFGLGVFGGIGCGVLATIAIFLPSFILIALFAPAMERLRKNPIARGALDGMNAAVVALIAVVAVQLAITNFRTGGALRVDLVHIAIFIVAFVLLLRTKLNATWLILSAGAIGVVRSLV